MSRNLELLGMEKRMMLTLYNELFRLDLNPKSILVAIENKHMENAIPAAGLDKAAESLDHFAELSRNYLKYTYGVGTVSSVRADAWKKNGHVNTGLPPNVSNASRYNLKGASLPNVKTTFFGDLIPYWTP